MTDRETPDCRCGHAHADHHGDGTCAAIGCSCTAFEPRRRYTREDYERDKAHRQRTGTGSEQ